jgi:ribosomal protein S18 acetylase RimI-like enzyme
MRITKYKAEHEEAVLSAIRNDPNWEIFTSDDAIETYRDSLKKSVTYVCHDHNEFCGYVRALLDEGFAIYISELYVIPRCRNRKIGRLLLEQVKADFSTLTFYALSDEDAYYENMGYKKIGSVFELK